MDKGLTRDLQMIITKELAIDEQGIGHILTKGLATI